MHGWSAAGSSRWAVLTDGRVFELGPKGFALRYVVDWGRARLIGERLWVDQDGAVTLVDLATGALTRLGRKRFLGLGEQALYVADAERVHRLSSSDLVELGSVPWPSTPDTYLQARADVMKGGAVVLLETSAESALADFTTGAILRRHLGYAGVRTDGARLVACDLDAGTMIEVDTASGATTATFGGPGLRCTNGGSGAVRLTAAAYGPDPRYVFWGEPGSKAGPQGLPAVVLAVGDTLQGTVARYEDRAASFEDGSAAFASFDGAHGRLCLGFGMNSVAWRVCDWELVAGGRATRSSGALQPMGVPVGARFLGQATSPSGDRRAALFERDLTGAARELAVAIAAHGKLARTIAVRSGNLPWGPLEADGPYQRAGVRPVGLAFFDERHLAVLPASDGTPDAAYLDVDTGSVQPLCNDAPQKADDCLLAGDGTAAFGAKVTNPRWISIWETDSLFDGTTGKTYSLKPTDAEWEKATRIVPACP
ncbi:MAG: hypothetical protein IT373_17435 [Polyangiaceae bacterium]|nr:hypothetical protein [Polyangiaceae bacterium]